MNKMIIKSIFKFIVSNLSNIAHICTIVAVVLTFYALKTTIKQFNVQLENQRIEKNKKWKANMLMLEEELTRNKYTANFIISSVNSHRSNKPSIPFTIYVVTALNQVMQSDFLLENEIYFKLVAINKLFLSSNRILENIQNLRNTYLLMSNTKQKNNADIILNEQMKFVENDAKNINMVINNLLEGIPKYYK